MIAASDVYISMTGNCAGNGPTLELSTIQFLQITFFLNVGISKGCSFCGHLDQGNAKLN